MRRRRGAVPAAAVVVLLTGCSAQVPEQQADPGTRRASPSPQAEASAAATTPPSPTAPSPAPSAAPTSQALASQAPASQAPAPAPAPARAPDPTAPFLADRSRDTARHDGARLSVVDLRFGRHVGYDRVVVDLAGDGRPGWFAQYRDVPRHQGSGHRVDIAGRTVLEVSVTGVRYPNERGAERYEGPRAMRPRAAGVVEQVLRGSVYEGHQQVFIGIDAAEQPFRVFRLPDPPRVVVDVQHPR